MSNKKTGNPSHSLLALALFSICALLGGCYYLQKPTNPIGYIFYSGGMKSPYSHEAVKDRALVIFMPGIRDYAKAFEKNGFIEDLYEGYKKVDSKISFDTIAVEAHFKYYQNRTILDRLREDIVLPAKSKGYSSIHFVGISLGGLGSLLYLQNHPDDVDTVLVLAPYLGEKEDYQYLQSANIGGNGQTPPESEIDIWPWISTLSSEDRSKLYMGYGKDDKFSDAHDLFSKYIPKAHSVAISGEHDWPTWKSLWQSFLVDENYVNSFQIEGAK